MTEINPAALRELVGECRKLLESGLCELVEELEPTLVDETRTHANATRDPVRRNLCLQLHADIKRDWNKLTPLFREALAKRAEPVKPGERPLNDDVDLASLQILGNDELTAQMAMREVIERVDAACSEETNALDRRISLLVLRNVLTHGYNPFRVESVCECLDRACSAIFPETGKRALLVHLVGGHLASELPQLYRSINETLIDADILPRLKRSYNNAAPANASAAAAETAKMMSTIERLAKARTAAGGGSAKSGGKEGGQEFLNALTTLQKTPEVQKPVAAGSVVSVVTPTNVVRLARESEAARHVAPLEAVALDIVSALFDLIFSDEHVSDGIKVLVGRLQVPVLRVAMLNQQFFADRSHPARRFLNSLSGIAIRWGKFVEANDPFYLKLSELVERIQNTYDGDTGVFDTALVELEAFIEERDVIEAEANRALAEAVRAREEEIRAQREAQAEAQRVADQSLAPLLTDDVPKAIELFLRSYWRDLLQSRIFASGADGAPVVEGLQIASQLIWSVSPKKEAEDRQRQASALPALLKGLNAGLDEIGISAEERRAFMDTLVELCLAALRAETRVEKKKDTKVDTKGDKTPDSKTDTKSETKPPVITPAPTLQVSHETQSGVRVQDISLPGGEDRGGENTPDRASMRRVKQLVRGDWVDFITAGQTRRERLTWINPSRTLILFSNHASECAISITPEALALRLQKQTVKLIKRDTPVFERALHGAVRSMDSHA